MGSGEQRILSCQEPGCSVHVIEYHASASQIKSLMTLSGNCEQHIRYDCKGAQLNKLYPNLEADQIEPIAWWTDPNGDIHFYWFGNGFPVLSGFVFDFCNRCEPAYRICLELLESHMTFS